MSRLGALGEGLIELSLDPDRTIVELGFGGDAANICVMAARLGTEARIGGRVGADSFGDALLGFWERIGVRVDAVVRDPDAATGLYLNEGRPGGEHRFVYYRSDSAGSRLRSSDLNEGFYSGLDGLVVTGVTLAISESAAEAAEAALGRAAQLGIGGVCVVNHRTALGGDGARLAELARRCRLVISSREDAEELFGSGQPAELLAALGGQVEEVVLSDGARGAVALVGADTFAQPAPAVELVNAAGAGDALAGAYLAGRLAGSGPTKALTLAVTAASLSVERSGCANSYPSATEVETALGRLSAAGTRSEAG